ncbi:COMMD4 [Cordylochernes scorpioides]|uniref:COMMD4 n=1 Tax=Cordylochernes scorpioides TaxID=51811 RepID=A0ABY6LK55_9ARAC|nr:COMMD4 [Cordylochernes scorpioides]
MANGSSINFIDAPGLIKIERTSRFRFCGELDCPDWVLAEITTISKLSSVKMRLFCNQVVAGIISGNMDHTELGDVKAAVGALDFILCSAAKHGLEEDEVLSGELQQLGLPRGLEVNEPIIQELVEEEDQELTTNELIDLHREQHQEVKEVISSGEEEDENSLGSLPSDQIREI